MLEMDVEKAVVDAVAALGLEPFPVRGFWRPAECGSVKGDEGDGEPGAVSVRVPPAAFEAYGLCEVSFGVVVALAARIDLDPTGGMLAERAGKISGLIQGWNLDRGGDALAVLEVPGVFSPHGIQVREGDGPTFNRETGIWAVRYNFTLLGTVKHGTHD